MEIIKQELIKYHINSSKKFIHNVKVGVFGTYVSRNDKFPKILQELNRKALAYYEMLPQKRYFNFKGWGVFHELYKNETFLYYIENFMILNLPAIANIAFKIRYAILKIMKKR